MKRLIHQTFLYLFCALILAGLSQCTAIKLVPDNQVLYTGSDIDIVPEGKIRAKKKIKEMLDANILPKPNTTILGMRPGLWFFYKAGNPGKKGLRNFMKTKLGQAPVYMRDIDDANISKVLQAHLINNGYFFSKVTSEVEVKGKKGKVTYTARVPPVYRIREISFPKMDTLFTNIDSVNDNSYLKPGQRYNLERLKAEQERIEQALENLGFFYFDDRHLIFEADSTVGDRQVDLLLTIEPGVPEKAKQIYRIGNVNIFPDYSISPDSTVRADTLQVDGFNYIDHNKQYRPETITKVINFRPGNIYRTIDREYTLQHLMSLGSFKFVDIRFRGSRSDSTILNTSIYLTPHLKKSIRGEVQLVSKSNNFVGPGLSLRFTNRNFLGGSEQFTITGNTSYEVQVSRNIPNPVNALEFGVESELSVPRIISPLNIDYPSRRYLPTTRFGLGFRLQERIGFFRLNSFNMSAGYLWRENTLKTHELYPVDISYVHLGNPSDEFLNRLEENPFLAGSFENQFILGSRYTYTLNTQLNEDRESAFSEREFRRTHFYFSGTADIAGNLMHLIQGGSRSGSEEGPNTIFGSAYSQFVRGQLDVRFFYNFDKRNRLATRVIVGGGHAYGNSVTMPYIKQFSVGGSNSVRAFPARTIGPGTFNVHEELSPQDPDSDANAAPIFIDQRGDLKLEGNLEYRFEIVGFLKGATFVDAGNIWLIREDPARPGGQFRSGEFLNELAVGTGIGLRMDFNFFVLRFDLAFPLRKPWLPSDERWVFDQIDFGSSSWRSDNLILNIAIGYPF